QKVCRQRHIFFYCVGDNTLPSYVSPAAAERLRLSPCPVRGVACCGAHLENKSQAYLALDRIALTTDADRMFLRLDAWAIPARVNLRELRSQKTDQRRVIDPEQQDYE